MPMLSPEGPHARRYVALLHDLVRSGGWLSDRHVDLRCTLYDIEPPALERLAGETPPFVARDEGGWTVTSQGLRRMLAWDRRERASLPGAVGPEEATGPAEAV